MKLSTMLASVALAGIMAGSLCAQDNGGGGQGGGGGRGRGGFMLKWSDFKFDTAPANADDLALTQAIYETAALSKLPDGADKDQAKTRIDARFITIAKAAGVTDPTADTKISENQFYKGAYLSMGQGMGGRGKKKKSADST